MRDPRTSLTRYAGAAANEATVSILTKDVFSFKIMPASVKAPAIPNVRPAKRMNG